MASHALRIPKLKGASLPPVMARSVAPERTIQNACPMACAAEEQAVEIVKLGPVMPNSMEMWLAPAFAIVFGNGQRVDAVVPELCTPRESRYLRCSGRPRRSR